MKNAAIYLAFITLATAWAHNTVNPTDKPIKIEKMGKYGWGYPYGWSHDAVIYESTHPNHHKHVKDVKRVKNTRKSADTVNPDDKPINMKKMGKYGWGYPYGWSHDADWRW